MSVGITIVIPAHYSGTHAVHELRFRACLISIIAMSGQCQSHYEPVLPNPNGFRFRDPRSVPGKPRGDDILFAAWERELRRPSYERWIMDTTYWLQTTLLNTLYNVRDFMWRRGLILPLSTVRYTDVLEQSPLADGYGSSVAMGPIRSKLTRCEWSLLAQAYPSLAYGRTSCGVTHATSL